VDSVKYVGGSVKNNNGGEITEETKRKIVSE
jgi:hypothetical protein